MIKEYRRKIDTNIYAEQFDGSKAMMHKYLITKAEKIGAFNDVEDVYYFLKTPKGTVQINYYDWIITDQVGENYSLKDNIFKLIYEEIK